MSNRKLNIISKRENEKKNLTQELLNVIIQYQASFKNDKTPWFSSFANWCLIQVGIVGTDNASVALWKELGMQLKPTYGAYHSNELFSCGFCCRHE
ncbi:MAG: hypothetical protein ACRC0A_05420 [Chitinophagaceae bacterium]